MKYSIFLVALTILASCNNKKEMVTQINLDSIAPISNEILETAIIYEANIRQYSPEGTFNKFTEDIPQLKELGVKVIWLMPIYPISTTKSKGTLGSYYAISDYTKVNPEFGNLDDVKNLIKVAHANGMYVILDWVANHTGWDHIWLKEHPEYYTKDDNGEITHTVGTDWTDVADLNYDSKEMRVQMLKDMKYWVEEVNIDGFRCDVAGMVPIDFWEPTIKELRSIKPIFMLAEAWEPELLEVGFDMAYGWDTHHKMNHIAQGKENVKNWDERMTQIETMYQKDDILMNFITNHDENSWSGTVKERMGDASEVMLALSYCTPGMPLIYSGQEYDMNKRLRFFEKDTIVKTKGTVWPLMEKLSVLKIDNKALHGGKNAASYTKINSSDNENILTFSREKEGQKITFMANLSKNERKFTFEEVGKGVDFMTKKDFMLEKGKQYIFKPWEYKIIVH
ncbi:alpha-amylase family glycosyl hydrolase [Lutibacter sp.]|uniref:alpha-amylase family glycosyl hydrolase n=1 Tax=Lutibacter sp. TaxID=1925666 RepID=UPI0027369136|nr:alpha-amylase family glycosyl hydrolase [Lutibacter sp.]MDP3312449.1 alpha-amylase family glycosyl hydrolase [Lutibacter sp.]